MEYAPWARSSGAAESRAEMKQAIEVCNSRNFGCCGCVCVLYVAWILLWGWIAGDLMVVCQTEKENSLSMECCQNPAFVL